MLCISYNRKQTKQMNTIAKRLSKFSAIAVSALTLISCSPPEAELTVNDSFLGSHRLSVSLNDSANGLDITFNNQSDSGASYHLLRSSNKDCDISNASVCSNVSELTNSEIADSGNFFDGLPSNTYYYQLRVTLPGNVISILKAQYPDIDPPSNVVASAGNAQVSLSWDAVSGAESYNIYMANQDGVSTNSYDSKIADVTSPFLIDDLSNGVIYYFVVTAENANNESDISEQVQATPTSDSSGNANPIADAGEDQNVKAFASVSLDGSGSSDSDGTIVSYSWRQTDGTEVELSGADQAIASFTAPDADATLEFELTVTDDDGSSNSDSISVNVTINAIPIADAGADQNVTSGVTVSLDGSGSSDSDGSIVSYSWEQIDGDITVSLTDASSAIASFTAPAVSISTSTVLQFQLSVSDDFGGTSSDTVTVTISAVAPGVELWSYVTSGSIGASSPAIGADGTVYIGSADDYLYALNPDDGSLKWRYQTGSDIVSSPTIGADGTIYIGSYDSHLHAIDSDIGSIQWIYLTADWVASSPAISNDGTVYIGSSDSHLYAIAPPSDDSQSGVLLWTYQTANEIFYSSPAIGADGTVYIGSRDGNLYAIAPPDDDSQSGKLRWRYQTAGEIDSSPAIGADGTVYVGSDDDSLYAITPPSDDSQIGILKWRFQTTGDIFASPAIGADGTIYIGSADNHLYALNPDDGSVQWSYQTDGGIFSSPAVGSDGTVYIGNSDDYIYAIAAPDDDSQSGILQWRLRTGNAVGSSPAIGANGTVYVGSNDNQVYAISSSSAGLADSAWPKFGRDDQNTANANNPPSVSAGASQSKNEGTVVNLVGSATDDGSIDSYLWQQVSGTAVIIFAEDNASASFVAPQVDSDSELVFQLTATDNLSASASATTTVTIQNDPNNQPPVAEAGDEQTVNEGTTVELSGLNSIDTEGSIQSYSWQQLSGSEVAIITPDAAQASFIAPETSAESNLTLVFALIVSDAAGAQAADSVSITVVNNIAPIVSAGPAQSTVTGVNVILYGSASDSDGSIVSLEWEETSGLGGIELSADDVATVSFTVPNFALDTQFVFELTATDDDGASTAATTTVTVVSEKTAQWTYTGAGNADFDSSPALAADGTIYVGSVNGRLFAFNPDGSLDWNYSLDSAIYSSPAIATDGSIYFGSNDNSLHALSPEGDSKWSFPTGNVVRSSPAVDVDGRIYFGSYDDSVYALEANGSQIWSYPTGGDIYSSPLVGADGVIYVGSLDSYLYALTTAGTLKWRYQTSGGIYSSPAQAPDGSIYVGSDDNYLHAIARDDGSRLWRYHTGSYDVYSSPAIGADGTIYVGSENSLLYALTAAGELIWSYDTGGAIISSPAIDSAGNIYFGSIDHYLYSLSPQGNLNWRYATDGDIYSSPAIASNGSIYFGSGDDKFYALRSAASGLQADSPWPKFRYNALNQGSSHNLRPSAEAGAEDQVLEGNTFTFNGTATDPDGTIAAFAWSQVQGISVSIANADSANASFIAPGVDAATELLFQLQVTDSSGGTGTDTVTITVLDNPDNQPPTVEAGANQSQLEGTEVSLNGSASDADGAITTYSWSQLSGSEVVLIDSNSAQASFIAPAVDTDTTLSFQLLVTDNDGAKATDTVTITVTNNPDNQPPVANAGADQQIYEHQNTELNASMSSDSDGSIVAYSWSQLEGPEVAVFDSSSALASFIAPAINAETNLIFQLLVTDNGGASAVDVINLSVLDNPDNQPPTVDAGDNQNQTESVEVSLSGSASDEDGSIVAYSWRQLEGPEVTIIDSSSALASFTAPAVDTDTNLSFQLLVTDDDSASAADVVSITVLPNEVPIVDAGINQSLSTGVIASLRGSASDNDGTIISYLWSETSTSITSSGGVDINRADTATANFSVPDNLSTGTILTFELTATDYLGASSSDSTTVTIATEGSLRWRYQADNAIYSSPAIDTDGTVYVGSDDNYLYAIAPPSGGSESGELLWRYKTGDQIRSSPAVGSDGTVYVGSLDNYLYAIAPPNDDSQSGMLRWSYQTQTVYGIYSDPAIGSDGKIYVSDRNNYLYAVAPPSGGSQSGVLQWRYDQAGDHTISSPTIGNDGTVYAGSTPTGSPYYDLLAIAPPSDSGQYGVRQWSYPTGEDVSSAPAIGTDGIVYVGSDDDYLYAIAAPSDGSQDGVLQWHYQTGGDIDSSPAIGADGTIYVGSGDKYLYAIAPPSDNSQSGVLLWRYQTGGPISSSPAIGADGTVYVSSRDHYLYAIAPPNDGGQSGTLQWRYQTGDEIHSSPAIDSDGTVYVGSDDGYLYAITSSSPGLADSAWPKFGYDNQGVGRANVAPTAEAGGSDQDIAAGATVNLDGSSSIDPDGAIIDYYWQETSGFDISILNNNSAQASFIAPDDLSSDAILTIQLTVTDNSGATATDTLEVSVSANP